MKRSDWQRTVVQALDGAGPTWELNGSPLCCSRCKYYDGKRCSLIGARPHMLCEPAVVEMVGLLDGLVSP